MIEITATGDTTLHTAGKYCEEDILVNVPAGGSGGGSGAGVETCTVSIKYAMASYFCSVYRDGVITDEIATDYRAQPTIANVICNSIFVIRSTVGHKSAENATLLASRYDDSYAEICIFRADAPPNGEIVIEFG